jgi:hypothetical protein
MTTLAARVIRIPPSRHTDLSLADCMDWTRVSFETGFDSKQPKLEPKLVSALSETKRLFRLFRFYTETEIFDVSIEPKRTEDQPKQFDREHIFLFFTENFEFFRFFWFSGFFSVFSVCFETGVTYLYFNICTPIRAFYIFFLFTTIFNAR